MNSGSKYFYELFINPEKHNFLSFEDPENPSNKIGFFSGSTRGRWGVCKDPNSKWYKQPMVDENGNSNEEAAHDDLMYKRSLSKGGLDNKTKHLVITQYPTTWKEAFLRSKGAIFASPELLEHLGNVETIPSLRDQAEKGELVWRNDELEFQPNDESGGNLASYVPSGKKRKDEDVFRSEDYLPQQGQNKDWFEVLPDAIAVKNRHIMQELDH